MGPGERCVSRRQSAQSVAAFAVFLLLVGLGVALVGDGAVLFAAHRRAALLAEAGARAGAGWVDLRALREDPLAPPTLDVATAERRAREYVARQQPDAEVEASARPDRLLVRVRIEVPATVLHLPGRSSVAVVAQSEAAPFIGEDTPE